jgi:hypothetical protein
MMKRAGAGRYITLEWSNRCSLCMVKRQTSPIRVSQVSHPTS